MNPLLDIQVLGWLLVGLGVVECVPALVALLYGESAFPFLASAAVSVVSGLPVALSARSPDRRLRPRDGFLIVGLAWILASIFGALPFLLSDTLSPLDSLFESVAGFTTTGSTVMTRIEGTSHALLMWRSLTQWLGGMGMIVFAVAILPLLGIGGMQLFKAEVPGPVADKLTPRISVTAQRMWMVYAGLTAAAAIALCVAGLDAFDAICHAFTTLSTGGYSTRDASIGAFGSSAVEWISIVFMTLGGMNFVLHYRILTGRVRGVLRDKELHYYLVVIGIATLLVSALIRAPELPGSLRIAMFQVVSILTTTGYGTADFATWPSLAQLVLIQLMVLGGMAGSTSGGIKSLRVVLSLRSLRVSIARGIHPHAIQKVKYGERAVSDEVIGGIASFFLAYALIAAAAMAIVAAAGYDLVTSASAVLTALGNVGPGLGAVGPSETFSPLPGYAKLTLCFCMIAGRLEIFTLLVLLQPGFWRR